MTYQRNKLDPFRLPVRRERRTSATLQNGVDQRLPDRIEHSEVAAGEDYEAQGDSRALRDVAAVRPLHAAQLVDDVPEEGQQPAAAGAALALDVMGGRE